MSKIVDIYCSKLSENPSLLSIGKIVGDSFSTDSLINPPTNGIYSKGHIKLGSTSNLAVNNCTPASTLGLTCNLPITSGNGSNSLPGYTFFSDNTAGMFYTTNKLNFSTQSANRLNIDNSSVNGLVPFSTNLGSSTGGVLHNILSTLDGKYKFGIGLQDSTAGSDDSNFNIFSYTGANSYWKNPLSIRRIDNTIQFRGNTIIGDSTGANSLLATGGFLYIPTCTGAPTGIPEYFNAKVALEYDTTNNKLYIYNGVWKSVTLT